MVTTIIYASIINWSTHHYYSDKIVMTSYSILDIIFSSRHNVMILMALVLKDKSVALLRSDTALKYSC